LAAGIFACTRGQAATHPQSEPAHVGQTHDGAMQAKERTFPAKGSILARTSPPDAFGINDILLAHASPEWL
jgi:hypothetical protein